MANEIFENMWKIMKENKYQLINEINNKLLCNICNKLMVKACNASCGCKYCSDCIANYLNGEDKFCPGNNKFCQMKMINFEKDVAIDYRSNIKISEIVVKCSNKYCEFTDELGLIDNHMRTCNRNPTSCPYFEMGCKNDEVINDEMKDHLCTEIHCHTKLLLDFINNLQNEMESMKNDIVELKLENKNIKNELDKIRSESENYQMRNEEFEKKIKNNLSEIEELNEEMVGIKNENRSLMNELEKIEKIRINEVIERMQRKSDQQTREIDELKEKYEQRENKEIEMRRIIDEIFDKNADLMKKSNNYDGKIDNYDGKINNYDRKINYYNGKIEYYDEKINNLQIKIIEMERITEKIKFVKFEWKIENFSQQKRSIYIYSESFYSYKNGYKMCLSVLIYGDSVDVWFHLMRGEFDDDLLWPFKHGVTIDIINQMNGTVHRRRTVKYDDSPDYPGWNKPTTERNDRIVFHSINLPKEIIQNNQLLIKCKINI